MRFDFGFGFGFGGHCPGASHQIVFLGSRGGWGGSTAGSASGSLQQPFFLEGVVGEVRLRVRLRVRWSLRAISVQSPVHHPSKPFFF